MSNSKAQQQLDLSYNSSAPLKMKQISFSKILKKI